MPVQRLDPDTMVSFPGLHQTVRAGNTVYIARQVAVDSQGNFHGEGDAEEQLRQIYRNLENACRAHGGTLASMVKTTTYITDRPTTRRWARRDRSSTARTRLRTPRSSLQAWRSPSG